MWTHHVVIWWQHCSKFYLVVWLCSHLPALPWACHESSCTDAALHFTSPQHVEVWETSRQKVCILSYLNWIFLADRFSCLLWSQVCSRPSSSHYPPHQPAGRCSSCWGRCEASRWANRCSSSVRGSWHLRQEAKFPTSFNRRMLFGWQGPWEAYLDREHSNVTLPSSTSLDQQLVDTERLREK